MKTSTKLLPSARRAVGILTILTAYGLLVASASGQSRESERQLLSLLRELKPLPKVHYSWPLDPKRLTALDPLLFEYARLTHAISLRGESATRQQIDAAVSVCARINRTKPEIRASIAVNYSPWHREFPKEAPPTELGRGHHEEIRQLRNRLSAFAERVAFANRLESSDVQVTAVIFDCERFDLKKGDERWNEAILAKQEAAADAARLVFPGARLEWYARGAVHPGSSKTGWVPNSNFTLKEPGVAFACSLYRVPEIETTRQTFRKTVEHADQRGVKEVTPWIALASGYRRTPTAFQEFDRDWNYDLIYSWQLGAELNHAWFSREDNRERFGPWHRAKVVIFYPHPFDPPHWGKHFVAYCRGAQLDKRLP